MLRRLAIISQLAQKQPRRMINITATPTATSTADSLEYSNMLKKVRDTEILMRKVIPSICIQYFDIHIENLDETSRLLINTDQMEIIETFKMDRLKDLDRRLDIIIAELATVRKIIEHISLLGELEDPDLMSDEKSLVDSIEFLRANRTYLVDCKKREDYLSHAEYFLHFWNRQLSSY